MPSLSQLLFLAPALFAAVHGQGVIIKAQGTKGSDTGVALQVKQNAADANIIRNTEIVQNIVNECGRTLLAGNIDIGTITEEQLVAKTVTSVTKGGTLEMTIAQGGANGAGPYTCDMDQTSNSLGAGQTKLKVAEKAPVNGNIVLTLTMPADMACDGGIYYPSLPQLFLHFESLSTNIYIQHQPVTSAPSDASTLPLPVHSEAVSQCNKLT